MSETQRSIELFYSYAQEDEALREKLEKHLSNMKQQGLITNWHQQKIMPGANRAREIDAHLKTAQIILLLVSSDFLASNYRYTEMKQALERHQAGRACVIPILLRPVDWQGTLFAELEPLPSNQKPITTWPDQDEALLDVAQGIRRAVEVFKTLPEAQVQPEVTQLESQPTNQSPAINGLENPATVFLSYAHEDTEEVRDLQLRLNLRGVRCWRDVDDMPVGTLFKNEIVQAIEHEADAIAFFITPSFLKSDFIWRFEVPAALSRHEHDPYFNIVPILQGVSFAEVRQFCYNRNLTDLSSFNGLSLTNDGTTSITREEQNTRRNKVAKRILQAAFPLRLRRINADRNYEPSLYLRTFVFAAPTASLDLALDWSRLAYEKEQTNTPQEWDEILWPALLDVKQTISEKVPSHRIHLFIKGILPIAVALGFAFRETTRITSLIEGQKETWSTGISPTEKDPLHQEWIYNDHGNQKEAVVEVATSRPTRSAVERTLPELDLIAAYHIRLESPIISRDSVRDAAHAQVIAQQVGQVCQKLCDERGVRQLHLFIATPVELAVLIGHQLNALCPITLYEYKSDEGAYKPIGTLRK